MLVFPHCLSLSVAAAQTYVHSAFLGLDFLCRTPHHLQTPHRTAELFLHYLRSSFVAVISRFIYPLYFYLHPILLSCPTPPGASLQFDVNYTEI